MRRLSVLVLWAAAAIAIFDGMQVQATYQPMPADVVLYSRAGSCPAGWTEYTAGRGRLIVGLPSGGTNEGTAGTALADLENRAVGQHTHVQDAHNHTQDSHNHTQAPHGHTVSGFGNSFDVNGSPDDVTVIDNAGTHTSDNATATNIAATATNNAATATNQNAGSVAGTNGPFVQLIGCLKL